MLDKNYLRNHYNAQRAGIAPAVAAKKNEKIAQNLLDLVNKNNFTQVFAYAATRFEPDLQIFFGSLGKEVQIGLPITTKKNHQMHFFAWKFGETLHLHEYGILVPSSDRRLSCNSHTVVLVPALAVDKLGTRLGYGGGYYDRYLATNSYACSIGVVFSDCFTNEALPKDSWDVSLQMCCTEEGVININRGFFA